MGQHCNSYGFSGGFAAILSAISWYLINNRECKVNVSNAFSNTFNEDHLKLFIYVAIIVGAVLFVLSFFDFAGTLYEVALLFYVAVIGIIASSFGMAYATYLAFNMSCKSIAGTIFDGSSLLGRKNVIESEDTYGIAITTLNLIAALLLFSAAISFARRY